MKLTLLLATILLSNVSLACTAYIEEPNFWGSSDSDERALAKAQIKAKEILAEVHCELTRDYKTADYLYQSERTHRYPKKPRKFSFDRVVRDHNGRELARSIGSTCNPAPGYGCDEVDSPGPFHLAGARMLKKTILKQTKN